MKKIIRKIVFSRITYFLLIISSIALIGFGIKGVLVNGYPEMPGFCLTLGVSFIYFIIAIYKQKKYEELNAYVHKNSNFPLSDASKKSLEVIKNTNIKVFLYGVILAMAAFFILLLFKLVMFL